MSVDAWGITDGYWSSDKERFETPPETREALLAAMGAGAHPDGPPEPSPPMWIVTQGGTDSLWNAADLHLEDGTVVPDVRSLPPDLPLGYHDLVPRDGWPPSRLVVTPARAHPVRQRMWGWAVQLYAARSRASWGIGDLDDLARLATWSSSLGAEMLVLNPLHAVAPVHPQQPSPYFPASRLWRNPLALHIESMPGASLLGDELDRFASAGRALDERRLIDRDAVFRLKRAAFDRLFSWWTAHADRDSRTAFSAFCAEHGTDLRLFAIYCADPCVAVVPILLAAAPLSRAATAAIVVVYEAATIATMVALTAIARAGANVVRGAWVERWGDTAAGGLIVTTGIVVALLGW